VYGFRRSARMVGTRSCCRLPVGQLVGVTSTVSSQNRAPHIARLAADAIGTNDTSTAVLVRGSEHVSKDESSRQFGTLVHPVGRPSPSLITVMAPSSSTRMRIFLTGTVSRRGAYSDRVHQDLVEDLDSPGTWEISRLIPFVSVSNVAGGTSGVMG
jgi:hypothetical protein